MGVYENCPVLGGEKWELRLCAESDAPDLLKVYSDLLAVPLFNSDNCNGDNFHYTTLERMTEAIRFWQYAYDAKQFVRFSIVNKPENAIVGTVELFNRKSNDFYSNCGLLRLDLASRFEQQRNIAEILSLVLDESYLLFECDMLATKAIDTAEERIKALASLGFARGKEPLIGHDGTEYGSYYYRLK
ncbi:MAG: N-acetyltransferase [Clostridium sp.]|jgi:hypothetical protein|nr:N-acetyltransferase [Clostridium sp.]